MVMRKRSSSSIPASSANFSAAASTSLTLSIVEGSEKLNFPAFGLVTGFVSASTGNGKAQRLTARGSNTSLGICGKRRCRGQFHGCSELCQGLLWIRRRERKPSKPCAVTANVLHQEFASAQI